MIDYRLIGIDEPKDDEKKAIADYEQRKKKGKLK